MTTLPNRDQHDSILLYTGLRLDDEDSELPQQTKKEDPTSRQ